MLVYVDDILITGSHPLVISSLITKLQQEFPFKDLGPLSFFLGIQVTGTSSGLDLYQTKYIYELLDKALMAESKPTKSPCTSGSKLSKHDGEPLSDPTIYKQIVSAL